MMQIDREIQTTMQTIPAQDGWFIAEPCYEAEGMVSEIDLSPVIAWIVESVTYESGRIYSYAHPVGVESVNEYYCLKRPDGRFIIPEVCWFENEEAVIRHFNERAGHAKRA